MPGSSKVMDVLFCADAGYFRHVAVAACSLARNGGGAFRVHLVTCDADPAAEAALRRSLARHPSLSLAIHRVPRDRIERLFVDMYLTPECYLRIVAPEVLPAEVERFLYLDCDVVVTDDLGPLFATEMGGKVLAAVPDYPMVPRVWDRRRLAELGIPEPVTYVNSGVLLIDAAAWRRERATERIMDFAAERGAQLAFHDQDAINAVLHDRIALLDCRWNLQARMLHCGRRTCPLEFEATRAARRRPGIVHYVGAEKPWKFRTRCARKRDYVRHLAMTEWRDARPELASALERAEWRLDRTLARAGIDYMQILWLAGWLPRRMRRLAGGAAVPEGAPGAAR